MSIEIASSLSGLPDLNGGAGRRHALGRVAIVLICDKNYLVPTLATALSADAHVSDMSVPIRIFVVDADRAWTRGFDRALHGTKISVEPAALDGLRDLSPYHRDDYLPPVTLARFWISALLEPDVERFLYLDGDVLVENELDTLLSTRPPARGLMAVNDFLGVCHDEVGAANRRDRAYLAGIGCSSRTYFNAGVLYCNMIEWNRIAGDAVRFLKEHPDLCIASDQTALNHVVGADVHLLPLRYNYQTDHMMVLDPRGTDRVPTIWHFTGAPKPWDADEWPWDASFARHMRRACQLLDGLDVDVPRAPEAQMLAGRAHRRRARRRLRWVYPWRRAVRRRKISSMLAAGLRAPAADKRQ